MLPVSQQDLTTSLGPAVLGSTTPSASSVSNNSQRIGPASTQSHYSAPLPPPPFSKVQRAAPTNVHKGVASAAASVVSLTSTTVRNRFTMCTVFSSTKSSMQAQLEICLSLQVLRTRQGLSKATVPFGALITPLPDLSAHSLPLLRRSPTACSACGAYMNAHCKVTTAAVNQHAMQ